MGTTAEKLTYLNTTKSKIRTGLNDLGAGLTDNDTFRSYANALADIYDELPKISDEGTDLELTPTKKGKLAITPKGSSSQFSTTGKNKLNIVGTRTHNGVTTTGTADGKMVSTGTTGNSYQYFNMTENYKPINIPAGDYIFSIQSAIAYKLQIIFYDANQTNIGDKTLNVGSTEAEITLTSNVSYYRMAMVGVGLQTAVNVTVYPMIRLSTVTDGSFEPYTDGPAPNSDYQYPVKPVTRVNSVVISNVNLFNKNTVTSNYYLNSDGDLVESTTWEISNFINVVPNETYTYTGLTSVGTAPMSCYYDENKQFISSFKQNTSTNNITIPSNAKFVRFTIRQYQPADFNTFMLVKGSTAPSEYVAHQEQNYQLILKSNNIIGLDTRQYPVDLKVGDKITITNNSSGTLNLNFYTNYGDETRNDNWSVQAGVTRTVTIGYDSKAIAWSSAPSGGLAWVNLGTTSLSYEPYTENPIELNSSPDGTTKDEIVGSPNNWFKREYIGKIQYLVTGGSVGSGGGDFATMKTRGYLCRYFDITNLRGGSDRSLIMSNRFKGTNATLYNGAAHLDGIQTSTSDTSSTVYIGIKFSTIEDYYGSELTTSNIQTAWIKYFTDHPTYIYFRVLEPQDIPITDATLISQLNDIYENAKSYNGTTNITSTYEDGNEQMVIDASALKSWNDSNE